MTRLRSAAPIILFAFLAILGFIAFAVRMGLVPDDAVTLWAGAITAGDGEMSIGRIIAAYPTIPFLATTLLEFVSPAGTPMPVLLAAVIVACLAGIWFLSFRDVGLPLLAAVAMTLLLALHPAVLRAAVGGPAEMLLVAFVYLLGSALYRLRARSAAPEVMAVALALLGLAFSHPMGAAIACAAMPFLVFAVRPTLVANSAINVLFAMVFPTVFAVAAFTYVSWVFPGSGWSFFTAPAESLSTWLAGVSDLFGGGLTGWAVLGAGMAVALALALAAPIAPVAIAWVYRRGPLVAPALVLIAATVTAAMIAVATRLFGNPASLIAAAPVLAVIVITRGPIVRQRLAIVVPLLVVGWIGGAVGLAIVDPLTTQRVRAAYGHVGGDPERTEALGLGGATVGRDGVLVDTFNAPAVVLGRGRARGLLSPSDQTFTLATLFSRIETPFVAVPDPQSAMGAQDRLNKAFPLLYRRGAPGYHVVYENASWRLFGRD